MKNETLINILKFLDGKKTITLGIISLIVIWILKEQFIDVYTAEFIVGVITLLGGSASVATRKLITNQQKYDGTNKLPNGEQNS